MATYYISNNLDSGDGSFREAYGLARTGDVILLDPNVDWGEGDEVVIHCASTLTTNVVRGVTIGDGSKRIVFDGDGRSFANCFMSFAGGSDVTLVRVSFRHMRASGSYGAAIRFTSGTFAFDFQDCEWIDCVKTGSGTYGAAIAIQATAEGSTGRLSNCVFFGNSSTYGSNIAFTTSTILENCPTTCYNCTFAGGSFRNAPTLVNCLNVSGDAGYVCYDETSSDALDLRLLDAGASLTADGVGDASFRVRLGYPDGSFAETTVDAVGTTDANFATNGNIALTWTRPDDDESDRIAVEYSPDGVAWLRKAIFLADENVAGATFCFNSPYRSAGTTRTEDEALDADGLPRRSTGFSLGAYETIDADRHFVNGSWSYSRFSMIEAPTPTETETVWLSGTASIGAEIASGASRFDAATLTLAPGAVVTLAADAGVGTLDVGSLAQLTIDGTVYAQSATLGGDARLLGDGYFSAGTFDREDGIVADSLRWRVGSTEVADVSVGNGRVEWTRTGDGSVVVERRSGDAWELIGADVSGTYVLTQTPAGSAFRVWDGAAFVTAYAPVELEEFWTVASWAVEQGGGGASTDGTDGDSWTVASWGLTPIVEHA